jgi:hypothetical protein
MKKNYLSLIILLCALNFGFGQTTVIDFETIGDGYTPSGTEGTGFTDVFNRTNPNIGGNNTFIWAVEDINLVNPNIALDQINVTGATSFSFSIDMLAHHFEDWDAIDELLITYSIDGGANQNLMWVQMVPGDAFNAPASLDLGFDGDGDCGINTTLPALTIGTQHGCTVSNNTFATFSTAAIPLSGNTTLDINLQFNGLDAADEGIYLDNITIDVTGGTPVPELQLVDNTSNNQSCGYNIDFGSIASDGSFADLNFTVENVGSDDLDISSLGITGDFSFVTPPATPFSIPPGNSQTLTIRFTPTANGVRTGLVTINNTDTSESTCNINLSGTGFAPTPEIDIERNTGTSIPNGAAANAGYNTIFAATVIGNSSAPKTFHVSSEGSADINLTNIASSNPTEFSVSLNPSPATVTPGTEVEFEITFSPNGVGLRTATITVISNDADESPYTFNVQGNGECAAGTLTFLPDNGPVNTIVNVTTSSTNFGGSTTASVNGIPATVNVISNSEIEVTIPSGATTGSLEIIDDLGCVSSDLFTVIDQQISSCEGSSGTTPLDLFISEITDHGSGSHSYVEIFNGTGATVDLTDYEIRIHNNGAVTATSTIPLTGSVPNNDVFVLAFGSTDATNAYSSHGYDQSDNASGINEDDNIRLYYTPTNTWVDVWGDTTGTTFTVASKNYTYRRKNSGITAPNTYGDTNWNPNDWDSFTPVDYSDIGGYDFSTGTPPTVNSISSTTTACNEVTISVIATEGFVTGNPLAYYWYAFDPANAGLGWQAISNGGIYTTNQASPDLVISDPNSVLNFQFYCQVREDDATCFTASNAIQITYSTATWNGTNWVWNDGTAIDTMPTTISSVIIDGDYDTAAGGVQTSFEACECIVNTGYELNIRNNTYVLVENDLTVNGNIVLETDGAFVQINDTATVGGDVLTDKTKISVEKETAPLASHLEYTYWSSPVTGELISDGLFEANANRIFSFDGQNFRDSTQETNNNDATAVGQDDIDDDANDWQFVNGATVMSPGIGYASTHDPLAFIGPNQYVYTFEGAFNNGVYNIPIYRNDVELNDNNWNFVGNPYPSAIDADLFLAANASIDQTIGATNGAIFFWSHNTVADGNTNGNENLNYAQSDYAIINGSGQTAGGDGIVPTRHIPSGQGFFISMDDGAPASVHSGTVMTTDVVFNNSMRVTGSNNQFFRTAEYNKLWLNLTSDNGVFNQVLIAYINGATDGDDGMYYDAHKNLSSDLYSGIYTTLESSNDKKFAIQGKDPYSLNIDEVIPLGFNTSIEEATLYTISIHTTEGDFMGENDIFIIDYDLNIIHNLKISDYNFTSDKGEFNERFEIVFTPEALSINDNTITANDISITELSNGEVQIKVSEQYTIDHVDILDILGRQVYSLNGSGSTEVYNLSKLSKAAYIAKVTLSNGQFISKKAIKQH